MPVPSSTHQTITFLRQRFEQAGVRLKTRHGQNFLIDMNLQRLILERAGLGPADVVLEVGSGVGSLGVLMAPQVAALVTVEIDAQMYQLASEELFGHENATIVRQDALANKNTLSPNLLELVRERMAAAPGRVFKLVANLPYCIATPVISNLLAADPCPQSMTVTIQKELADRITAAPGTKDYSGLSVWVQSQCRVELVRALPPTVFWPRPKVNSAIIHIDVDLERKARLRDAIFFHRFLRDLFCHRRKFLRGVLVSAFKQLSKPTVDEALAKLGFPGELRAEQLGVDELIALSDEIQQRLKIAVAAE